MAYNTRQLLMDLNNNPIPQQYDKANDSFVPLQKMEYYGKSTDIKPDSSLTPKGATYLELDTKTVYINDGSTWVVF